MITGINVNQRIEFISKHDKSEPKTIFILRPLTGLEQFELARFVETQANEKGKVTGYIKLSADYVKHLLSKVVIEVKNFRPEMPVIEILESLPSEIILELIQKATALSGLTEDERKNS